MPWNVDPQIAAIMRDHIIANGYDLKDLVSFGRGLATLGPRPVHVDEPYVAENMLSITIPSSAKQK